MTDPLKHHHFRVCFVLISLNFRSSYDNSQLCSCSSDKTVILWDVASGQVTRKLRGHAGVRRYDCNFPPQCHTVMGDTTYFVLDTIPILLKANIVIIDTDTDKITILQN